MRLVESAALWTQLGAFQAQLAQVLSRDNSQEEGKCTRLEQMIRQDWQNADETTMATQQGGLYLPPDCHGCVVSMLGLIVGQ